MLQRFGAVSLPIGHLTYALAVQVNYDHVRPLWLSASISGLRLRHNLISKPVGSKQNAMGQRSAVCKPGGLSAFRAAISQWMSRDQMKVKIKMQQPVDHTAQLVSICCASKPVSLVLIQISHSGRKVVTGVKNWEAWPRRPTLRKHGHERRHDACSHKEASEWCAAASSSTPAKLSPLHSIFFGICSGSLGVGAWKDCGVSRV